MTGSASSPPGAGAGAASPAEAGAVDGGDGPNASPPSAGNGNGNNGGGNRSSLRKSLKFLPDLLGGLSPSNRLSRRHSQPQQQTASQASVIR